MFVFGVKRKGGGGTDKKMDLLLGVGINGQLSGVEGTHESKNKKNDALRGIVSI